MTVWRHGIAICLTVAGILYPFLAYAVAGELAASWLMLPLALIWLARGLTVAPGQPGARWLPAAAALGCLLLAVIDTGQATRWYPVLVNAAMLTLFGATLVGPGPTAIERLARLRHPDLPEAGIRYTRRVTQMWVVFFALNGTVAAALALWAPWSWWAAYNGGISYLLIGALLVGERMVRPRHPETA